MKKVLTLLSLLCMVCTGAWAEYTVNYTGTHTHSGRQVTAVKVSSNGDAEQSITVDPSATYNDLSSQKFTVEAGGSIKVSLTHTGSWMNAAVLVDEDKNGAFNYTTGTLSQHTFSGDLKAFSFYCFDATNDQTGYNSLGTQITGDNRSTTNIPEFTAPAAIGEYRMRVLFAWNSVDPAGYSNIYSHGGYIIDVTLNVVEPVAPDSYPYLFFKCGRGDSKNGISANNNGTLSTPAYSESDENQKFLLVKIENKSYLYNVGKQKFVTSPASGNNFVLVDYPHHAFTTSEASNPSGEYTTILKINNAKMNNNNSGSMVNGWETEDAGNRFQINEVGSISADDYNALVAEIKEACNAKRASMLSDYDYTYGTTLGTYTWNKANTDAAKEEADALAPTANNYYTSLFAAIRKYDVNYTPTIVVPQENSFLRVKNNSSNKYVSSNATAGNAVPLVTAEDATSILYYDGSKFIGYVNGLGFIETYKAANLSQTKENISFSESSVRGKYYLQSNYTGSKYWHGGGSELNRNSSADASCIWNLSYVDALPVNMVNVAGAYYASLYLPVAVTLPEGVSAYSGNVDGDVLTLSKVVEGGDLAANMPVILYSASEVTEPFAIAANGAIASDNELFGTLAAQSAAEESLNYGAYVLNKSGDNVGFYKTTTKINGFKAYLPAAAAGGVQKFSFNFNEEMTTAIRAIESENSGAEIFDAAGNRLKKAQKGMNIINGHKVIVK